MAAPETQAVGWLQVQEAGAASRLCCRFPVRGVEAGHRLDSGQHVDQTAYDEVRTGVLGAEGYRVLRYWNDDALLRTTEVLEDILRELEAIQGRGNSKSKV